jgi:hypothetical protein
MLPFIVLVLLLQHFNRRSEYWILLSRTTPSYCGADELLKRIKKAKNPFPAGPQQSVEGGLEGQDR